MVNFFIHESHLLGQEKKARQKNQKTPSSEISSEMGALSECVSMRCSSSSQRYKSTSLHLRLQKGGWGDGNTMGLPHCAHEGVLGLIAVRTPFSLESSFHSLTHYRKNMLGELWQNEAYIPPETKLPQ